ncbi:hypothetical protein GCM10025795_01190 [Verticiella sediminum]
MLIASALDETSGRLLIAAIPTERRGISLNDDWNSIGQRQTDSGSALFEKVRVEHNELLLDPGPLATPLASLRPLLAQLTFVQLFIGQAAGALEAARHYTLHEAYPWVRSPAERAADDPHVLARYGEFWADLEAAIALADRAAAQFDAAWRQGDSLDWDTRGKLALAIAAAKVSSARAGLAITGGMFEVTGARATHGALALDRYWRNVRTQTLHDPLHYKLQELGEWALKGELPSPSFYA